MADLKKVQVGPDELQSLFEYKSHLNRLCYDINTLHKFQEISSKYDEKDLFMAIERYHTIKDLEAEIQSWLKLHQYLHSVGINDKIL